MKVMRGGGETQNERFVSLLVPQSINHVALLLLLLLLLLFLSPSILRQSFLELEASAVADDQVEGEVCTVAVRKDRG